MGKFQKISVIFLLLIAVICHTFASIQTGSSHHKVRHKHNLLQFDDQRVNEIREAFYDYKSVVQKPKTTYDDVVKLKPLRHHRRHDKRLEEDLTLTADEDRNGETSIASLQGQMVRYKRVHTTEETTRRTTTEKFSDNYDDEYSDEDDKTNLRVNDESTRVQETETAGQSLTDIKMQQLSTREGVEKSFQQELRKSQEEMRRNYDQATILKRIRENILRTKTEGMCRWPTKQVLEMPYTPSKTYMPRKYVLHQCSDNTACCGSPEKTCVAKKSDELVLWFHVRSVGSNGYESLKVRNHTECECVAKSRKAPPKPRVSHSLPKTTTRQPSVASCKCPSHFDVEIDDEDESCGCVCKKRAQCWRRYEGREGFTMTDQRCIMRQECSQPICLYGSYSTQSGRCPDRNEKLRRGFEKSRQ